MSHPHRGLNERGRASFRGRVSFSQPFAEPPRLIIAISGLDIRNDYPTSVTAETERAAVDGFGLRSSMAYGGVQEVTLTWVAIGAAYQRHAPDPPQRGSQHQKFQRAGDAGR